MPVAITANRRTRSCGTNPIRHNRRKVATRRDRPSGCARRDAVTGTHRAGGVGMRGFEDYCWRDLLTEELERVLMQRSQVLRESDTSEFEARATISDTSCLCKGQGLLRGGRNP